MHSLDHSCPYSYEVKNRASASPIMNADAINSAINCYVTRLQRQDFNRSPHIFKDVLFTEASSPALFICYYLCFLQILDSWAGQKSPPKVSVFHFWQVWSKTDFTTNALTLSNPNHEHWSHKRILPGHSTYYYILIPKYSRLWLALPISKAWAEM